MKPINETENSKPELKFKQSNAVTTGRYDYTAAQLDVFCYLLALTRDDDPPDMAYRIHMQDLETLTGRKMDYKQFADNVNALQSRPFKVSVQGKTGVYAKISPFDKTVYNPQKGYAEIVMGRSARPYFFELKREFTTGQVRSLLLCTSKFAKRLYTMCMQWNNPRIGKFSVSVDELKERLCLKDTDDKEPEQYTDFSAFRTNVLELAKQQINEHADIEIDYKATKRGRMFTDLVFTVKRKKPVQMQIDFKKEIDEQIEVAKIRATGISSVYAQYIVEHKKIKEFYAAKEEMIEEARKRAQDKNKEPIKDTASFLLGMLKNKGIVPIKDEDLKSAKNIKL